MTNSEKRRSALAPALRRYGLAAFALSAGLTAGFTFRREVGHWLKTPARIAAASWERASGEGPGRVPYLVSARGSVTVRDSREFQAEIAKASAGETIYLAPGDYTGLRIHDLKFDGVVTITSLDAARPAVMHDLSISKSAGVRFHDLEFSTAGAAITAAGSTLDKRAEDTVYLFVRDSNSIEFDHINFHGAPDGTLYTDVSAMIIQDCENISVKNSQFQHFHNAIGHLNVNHLTVSNNIFHDLQDDGIRGGGSSYVKIIGNRFDSLHLDATDKDHPDCIQFWTVHTTVAGHDILIEDNIYTRGHGHPVQGIFFKDQANVHYTSLVINNNLIIGSEYNGISVSGAIDVVISNNIVAEYDDQRNWIQLRDTNGATLTHNRAAFFGFINSSRVRESDDQSIGSVHDQGAALLRAWRPSAAGPARAAADVRGGSSV